VIHGLPNFIISKEKRQQTMADQTTEQTENTENKIEEKPKKQNKLHLKTGVVIGAVIVILLAVGIGGYGIHQSNTNPNFCGICHIMEPNVTSYLTSNNLDNVHDQANVECKECHDYPLDAEIASGVNFLIGNYSVGDDGKLLAVKYDDEMCLQCHISYEHLAKSTDYLKKNPHSSHLGQLACNTCHVSHGEQIDYCSTCHDNGGQEMIGADEQISN
jgi:nitrate/TMAO reductase-like tetraheme cytochrome c subunit